MAQATTENLLARIQTSLHMSQRELGEIMGCSRRTVIRYMSGGATLLPGTWEKLARVCHPGDRDLAAELATRAGHTLLSLGLEKPPAPPAAPPPPAPAPVRPAPSSRHLVDSVVCAAAEAMQTPPHVMRPALIAAFQRAAALGMTMEGVIEGLGTTRAGKAKA
jgi:transcriptional regulator with XRE-family HTH domain